MFIQYTSLNKLIPKYGRMYKGKSFINADLPALKLELPVIFRAVSCTVGDLGLRPAQLAWMVQGLHLYSGLLNTQLIEYNRTE